MISTVLYSLFSVTAGCHNSNSLSAGGHHTCAILVGVGVKCWGNGTYGQLGYDSTDSRGDEAGDMANLTTVNLTASAIAITAGHRHTCVILVGGDVKCWGRGTDGRLGYDSPNHKGNEADDMGGRAASRPWEGSQPSVRGAGLLVGRELIGSDSRP